MKKLTTGPAKKFVRVILVCSFFSITSFLLNSCNDTSTNSQSADSTAAMNAPMSDSDTTANPTIDTSGGKDTRGGGDKKP